MSVDNQPRATRFQVIPAIDLRGGKCVRLLHGDFEQETIFDDDPAAVARRWQAEGAERLHVVDLEGSRDGVPRNAAAIEAILGAVTIPVQVAGGVRDETTAARVLAAGADRVVVGTAAVRDPELIAALIRRHGAEAVIVALDARDGEVRVDGWTRGSGSGVLELATRMQALGASRFLYTDISRDGALTGPNVDAYRGFVAMTGARVIASGGLSRVDDVIALEAAGAEGVVAGRALYTGALSLPKALAAAAGVAT